MGTSKPNEETPQLYMFISVMKPSCTIPECGPAS